VVYYLWVNSPAVPMKISLFTRLNLEGYADADIPGIMDYAEALDYFRALWLYLFLTSVEGKSFIDRLRATKNSLEICRVRNLASDFDMTRVVITGSGLVMHYHKGVEVIEDPISCLHACYFWRKSARFLLNRPVRKIKTANTPQGKVGKH